MRQVTKFAEKPRFLVGIGIKVFKHRQHPCDLARYSTRPSPSRGYNYDTRPRSDDIGVNTLIQIKSPDGSGERLGHAEARLDVHLHGGVAGLGWHRDRSALVRVLRRYSQGRRRCVVPLSNTLVASAQSIIHAAALRADMPIHPRRLPSTDCLAGWAKQQTGGI
jgi:hypothetical protein